MKMNARIGIDKKPGSLMMLSSVDSLSLGFLLDKKINTYVFKLPISVDMHHCGRTEIPDGRNRKPRDEK